MTKIVFSFDTENFVSPDGADGILRSARILQEENIRGCFNVVGRLAEALVKWGRQDVIEALKYHEIDTHSLAHSYHPTINEYTDVEDYEAAMGEFLRREEENLEILRRVFGTQKVFEACPPGDSVSYVAHYGYARMGIPIYAGDTTYDRVRNRPVHFCNMASLEYNCAMEYKLIDRKKNTWMSEDEIRGMLDEIAATKDYYIFYHHPDMSMFETFWDLVNFYGDNTPPEQWKDSPRLPLELTEKYYENFRLLVRLVKKDPRFSVVSYENIAREIGGTRRVTKDLIPALKAQLEEDFFPVTLPGSFCLSDLFHACRALLSGEESHTCGTVYGFLEEPYAIESAVTVTASDMIASAKKLSSDGFLPLSIPVGEEKLGPADWLRGALAVLCGESSVTIRPGPWQIDLEEFRALKRLDLKKSWVNVKFMEDRYLSRRSRLQTWTIRLPEGSYRKIF